MATLMPAGSEAAEELSDAPAADIVRWVAKTFSRRVLSTSFGIQSGVMLHLVTRLIPDIPVVWVDTGYLMRETYQYAEAVTERLGLNLLIYQSPVSPARMEATIGRPWEGGDRAVLDSYDQLRKVEPMQRALRELNPEVWLSGLRSEQSSLRSTLPVVGEQWGVCKVLPLLRWTTRDVVAYLEENSIPVHPLHAKGYVTVGDWHSSRPVAPDDDNERVSRFGGVKEECGLHLPETVPREDRRS